jgi:hypothetical protein
MPLRAGQLRRYAAGRVIEQAPDSVVRVDRPRLPLASLRG